MELTLQYDRNSFSIFYDKSYNPCFYGINFAMDLNRFYERCEIGYNPCFYGINFAMGRPQH